MRLIATALGGALILTGCSADGESKKDLPEHTYAVEPVSTFDSEPLSRASTVPTGTVSVETDWFTLSLPEGATQTMVSNPTEEEAGETYIWSIEGYDLIIQKNSTESSHIQDFPGADIAKDNALYYLTMIDGPDLDPNDIQAGVLEGWEMQGYYVAHHTLDTDRVIRYFFSDETNYITLTYFAPYTDAYRFDITNSFNMKDN